MAVAAFAVVLVVIALVFGIWTTATGSSALFGRLTGLAGVFSLVLAVAIVSVTMIRWTRHPADRPSVRNRNVSLGPPGGGDLWVSGGSRMDEDGMRPQLPNIPRTPGQAAREQILNERFRDKIKGREFLDGSGFDKFIKKFKAIGAVAVIIIADIDSLTQINNRCGTQVGDAVLDKCRELLIEMPSINFGGRAGDDTFFGITEAIFFTIDHRFKIGEVSWIAEEYVATVSAFDWASIEKDLRVTCSAGYAAVHKDERARDTAARAVAGFRKAKDRGGNGFVRSAVPEH